MAERTAWRICTEEQWWSAFGEKHGKNGETGHRVRDDLVERDLPRIGADQLWLSAITGVVLARASSTCAIKDVFSNRIVGWSIGPG